MFSDHYLGLSAPKSVEHFVQSLQAISASVGANRFLVIELSGVTGRNVENHFHNGGPIVEVQLKGQGGRLVMEQCVARLYNSQALTIPLVPGLLNIDGFECGVASLMRGERRVCVVIFAGAEPTMEMLGAANVSAQCALQWFATLPNKVCPLSERELQCLRFYAARFDAIQTGQALGISASTVNGHLSRARLRCGVESTLAAAMLALDEGWIQPSEIRRIEAAG